MDKSSIIITATDYVSGKAQQKTVTDVNPAADNSHLKTFAQMTAALTKDNYVKSKRVDVIDLDNVTPKPVRQITKINYRIQNGSSYSTVELDLQNPVINLTLSQVYHVNQATAACWWFDIYTPFDGACPLPLDIQSTGQQNFRFSYERRDYGTSFWLFQLVSDEAEVATYNFTLHFNETTQYQAFNLPVIINITQDPEP